MSRHKYLTFPDDFRDQSIARRTGFVPFPHRVTRKAQEFTGRKRHQPESTAAAATAITTNTATAEQ